MSNPTDYMKSTEKLFEGMGKLARKQTDAQDELVAIINDMCDSLEMANDLIAKEISSAITDINRIKGSKIENIHRCFEKQALRFSNEKLHKTLKAGKVCGDLRKLGKRFGNPLSGQAMGSQSLKAWLSTLFNRSSKMKMHLDRLYWDERDYINHFSELLVKARDLCEKATTESDLKKLNKSAENIKKQLRKTRSIVRANIVSLRNTADRCIDSSV